MRTAELDTADLADLRAPRRFPAVSVILPTHRTYPENRQDPIRLRNLLDEASIRLREENVERDVAREVVSALDHAAADVDLTRAAETLVLLAASGGEQHSFVLPYVHAKERVVIGQSFATRDLIAASEHVWNYWVLALSEQSCRLWSGAGEELAEAALRGFPMPYSESLPAERSPVPRAREAAAFDCDRREQFFRDAYTAMACVLASDPRPVVLAGVRPYLSYFGQLPPEPVRARLIGSAEGRFDEATGAELADLIAPVLTAERARWQRAAIGLLERARSERLFASGLGQVWELAATGQVWEALVEEGYLAPARLAGGRLLPPDVPGGEPVEDAVDDIVDDVLDGGGEVIFVPDGSLDRYQHIAASLRY
jgi:Bacterial archaeo-eukaryotic release factor family 3